MRDRLRGLPQFLALVFMFGIGSSPMEASAQLTQDQQKCVNRMNKDFQKLASALGKEVLGCIKDHNKGRNAVSDIGVCVNADRKGKVQKARDKVQSDHDKRCLGTDRDGQPRAPSLFLTDAATVQTAAAVKESGMLSVIYGSDIHAAAIDEAQDKSAAQCQEAVARSLEKCQETKLKEFNRCKKDALRPGKDPFPSGASSQTDLARCILADPKGKIARACDLKQEIKPGHFKLDKVRKTLDAKCLRKGVDLALAFPDCASTDAERVHECLERPVECLVCNAINQADALGTNCDLLDNGSPDDSCHPTEGARTPIGQQTIDLPSVAAPAETPGTPGVSVSNPNLVTQFGNSSFSLNRARYTRYFLEQDPAGQPDAILILVPGFEGGAGSFRILAENLIRRAHDKFGTRLEVWGFDRRGNQLEDLAGLDIAEALQDAEIGLDWLYGDDLGTPLHPALAAGPNRRAIIHDEHGDIPFLANWTPLVFSQDIDAVVQQARTTATNSAVFLGGHSAGTGFTARYAATDFNLSGVGSPDPGYSRLRGLVLLEGGGGSSAGPPPDAATLDRIEDRFDGALFEAVRTASDRCVDGTACTTDADCAGKGHGSCIATTPAYAVVPGLLNPKILAASEPSAIQAMTDPDSGLTILLQDQGSPGNNAITVVPELATLAALGTGTAFGGLGAFLDDDGLVASLATFVATSIGAPGPVVNGLQTWTELGEGIPPSAFSDNGPAPTSLPAGHWGIEREPTRLTRMAKVFYQGQTNFTDWYYPSSGLGVTDGLPSLDTSSLSVGRGRRDIANRTQAAQINIPVICLGATNGLTTVPGDYVPFGESLGTCTAPSCDGSTPRVIDAMNPNEAFPVLGDLAGGFEVHLSEGYSHVDIVTAENDSSNHVVEPIVDFIERNR